MSKTKTRAKRNRPPAVVAPPGGASVVIGFQVTLEEDERLRSVGDHLTSMYAKEVNLVCHSERTTKNKLLAERKKEISPDCNDAYASTILCDAHDQRELSIRNLKSLIKQDQTKLNHINKRLKKPTGDSLKAKTTIKNSKQKPQKNKGVDGYRNRDERWNKQRHAQKLENRIARSKSQLSENGIRVCLGGKDLLKKRHNLEEAGMTVEEWKREWYAARFYLRCDGRSKVIGGNRNIRLLPVGTPMDDESVLRITLPHPLEHLSTPVTGLRKDAHVLQLSMPIKWNWAKAGKQRARMYHQWRAKVDAQESLTYSLKPDPHKPCYWYLTVSWKIHHDARTLKLASTSVPAPVESYAVDVNYGHIDGFLLDEYGNPKGPPDSFQYGTEGSTESRLDSIRRTVHEIVTQAKKRGAKAIVIEDLNFEKARTYGKEFGTGKTHRRKVSNIPTARIAEAFASKCYQLGLFLVAVDPAYTSQIGETRWGPRLDATRTQKGDRDSYSAIVIGRKSQGHKLACKKQPTADNERDCSSVIARHSPDRRSDASSPDMAKVKKKRTPKANLPITRKIMQLPASGTGLRLPTESTGTSPTTVPGAASKYARDKSILQ